MAVPGADLAEAEPPSPLRVTAAFDPVAWIELLDQYQVEFILVGGFAGNLYGAGRPTMDIDIVPRWEHDNLARLCEALRSVEAVSTTGPKVEDDAIVPAVLIDREVMTWNTRVGRIDTMVGIPNADGAPVDYDELETRAVVLPFGDTELAVASLDDVIISKEYASRRKDAEALPELRRLRDRASGDGGAPNAEA